MAETEAIVWKARIRRVGVVGLNGLGERICRRLVREGKTVGLDKVAAFDADALALARLDGSGVVACKSAAHLVDGVDLVLLSLPGGGEVAKIARSHDGLLDCARQGQIIVDHSASSLDLMRQLATAFARRGAAFLDAPIEACAETSRAIEAGDLAFAIGGDGAAIDAALPALRCFGGKITTVGAVGGAQLVRHLSDLVAIQTFAALAEALVAAHAFGVDGAHFLDALAKGNGAKNGAALQSLAKFMGGDQPDGEKGTTIADAERRLREAVQLADARSVSLHGAQSTLALFEKAKEKGLGDKDLSSLFSALTPAVERKRRETR